MIRDISNKAKPCPMCGSHRIYMEEPNYDVLFCVKVQCADAIDEYKKKVEFEYKWLFDCKVFNPNVVIAFETLISYAEQLKEQ